MEAKNGRVSSMPMPAARAVCGERVHDHVGAVAGAHRGLGFPFQPVQLVPHGRRVQAGRGRRRRPPPRRPPAPGRKCCDIPAPPGPSSRQARPKEVE